MFNILIFDNYLYGQKKLIEIIKKVLPLTEIFQAESFLEAINILEQEKIDVFLLNSYTLKSQEMTVVNELPHKPIIILISDDNQIQIVPYPADSGVVGYFIRNSFTMRLIENLIETYTRSWIEKEKILFESALGTYPVNIDSIVAIEITKRNTLSVYTKEKILRDVRGTLSELVKVLPKDFVHISRQCVLNRQAITRIINKSREVFISVQEEEVGFVCSREKVKYLIDWFNTIKKDF